MVNTMVQDTKPEVIPSSESDASAARGSKTISSEQPSPPTSKRDSAGISANTIDTGVLSATTTTTIVSASSLSPSGSSSLDDSADVREACASASGNVQINGGEQQHQPQHLLDLNDDGGDDDVNDVYDEEEFNHVVKEMRSSRVRRSQQQELQRRQKGGNADEEEENVRWSVCGLVGDEQKDESYFDDRPDNFHDSSDDNNDIGDSADGDDDGDEPIHDEKGRIRFSRRKLYGREKDLQTLNMYYETMLLTRQEREAQQHEKQQQREERSQASQALEVQQQSHPQHQNIICRCTSSFVFLSGYSGCGKSALVKEFKKHLCTSSGRADDGQEKRGPLFLHSKCEMMDKLVPFSAFSRLKLMQKNESRSTNDQSKQNILDTTDTTLLAMQQVQGIIEATIGDDAIILRSIFPLLRSTYNENDDSQTASDSTLSELSEYIKSKKLQISRMKFIFSSFFRVLSCCVDRPVVMFIDDIQWVDDQSLDMIESLMTDLSSSATTASLSRLQLHEPSDFINKDSNDTNKIGSLFFIGGYRSNEVDKTHKLYDLIHKNGGDEQVDEPGASDNTDVVMNRLELALLSKTDIGEFISDTLRLDSTDAVLPLTDAIYSRTLGNIYFTMQALEQLVRQNVLYYDVMTFCWSWSLSTENGGKSNERDQQLLEELLSDDIVDMIRSKIQHLSSDIQSVLVVAAYTRATFDVETLFYLLSHTKPGSAAEHLTGSDQNGSSPPLSQSSNGTLATASGTNVQNETVEVRRKKALVQTLQQAVSEGLLLPHSQLSRSSANNLPSSTDKDQVAFVNQEYSFIHDKVQEAARSFMADAGDKRDQFLLQIGAALYKRAKCESFGEDWMYFAAAQHLNAISNAWPSVSSCFLSLDNQPNINGATEMDKINLAELNLHTAKLSMRLLSFSGAVEFAENGVRKLPDDFGESRASERETGTDSKSRDELAFQLYVVCAEAHLGRGNLEKAEYYCNVALRQRKQLNKGIPDSLPAYKVFLGVLQAKSQEETFRLVLKILKQLGCTFPTNVRAQTIKAKIAIQRTKALCIRMLDEESINRMQYATDPVMIDTLDFLDKAASSAYQVKNMPMYVLLRCKWIKRMGTHGLTDSAGGAIASFSNIVTHVYGDFETGTRLAELALLIQDRLVSKFGETHALNSACHHVLSWVRPLRSCVKYHNRAFESGLMTGNIEGSLIGKWMACWSHLYSTAVPLSALANECQEHAARATRLGYGFYSNASKLIWQCSLNLMGKSEETIELRGKVIGSFDVSPLKQVAMPHKMYLYTLFAEYERGAEEAIETGDEFSQSFVGALFGLEQFYRGLNLYVAARRTGNISYKKAATKILKQVQDWANNKGCVNIVGPAKLLAAEDAALHRKKRLVCSRLFEDAISICSKDGFRQNAGLASERYADYLLEMGDPSAACSQLSSAIDNYKKWGASRKVEMLQDRLANLSS